jgi:hypothetical protein
MEHWLKKFPASKIVHSGWYSPLYNEIARQCFHACKERKAQPKQESLFVAEN